MHLLSWLSAASLTLSLLGCTTARNYPLCFYDTELGAAAAAQQQWPEFERRLRISVASVVGGSDDIQFVTSREAVVVASERKHRMLAAVWPSLACFGESAGTTDSQLLKICETAIQAEVEAGRPHTTELEAPCQTFALP